MKKVRAGLAAFLIGMISMLGQAFAASSEWQDLGGGKARLHVNVNPQSMEIDGALEVKLKPGWSTYWRYPGSSGIPPLFDFTGSDGVHVGDVSFPVPVKLGRDGHHYAGYKNSVAFPFTGKIADIPRSTIRLKLLMGVCEEICIPAQAQFSIDGKQLLQTDLQSTQLVNFSKLTVPKSMPASDFNVDVDHGKNDSLEISLEASKLGKKDPELFVEGPQDWYLVPATLKNKTGNKLVFSLDVSRAPDGTDFSSQKLKYTLVTGSSGFEFEH